MGEDVARFGASWYATADHLARRTEAERFGSVLGALRVVQPTSDSARGDGLAEDDGGFEHAEAGAAKKVLGAHGQQGRRRPGLPFLETEMGQHVPATLPRHCKAVREECAGPAKFRGNGRNAERQGGSDEGSAALRSWRDGGNIATERQQQIQHARCQFSLAREAAPGTGKIFQAAAAGMEVHHGVGER